MTSLAELIEQEASIRPNETKLSRIFRVLTQDEQDAVANALLNPDVSHAAIARALTKGGHPISEKAIRAARDRA